LEQVRRTQETIRQFRADQFLRQGRSEIDRMRSHWSVRLRWSSAARFRAQQGRLVLREASDRTLVPGARAQAPVRSLVRARILIPRARALLLEYPLPERPIHSRQAPARLGSAWPQFPLWLAALPPRKPTGSRGLPRALPSFHPAERAGRPPSS